MSKEIKWKYIGYLNKNGVFMKLHEMGEGTIVIAIDEERYLIDTGMERFIVNKEDVSEKMELDPSFASGMRSSDKVILGYYGNQFVVADKNNECFLLEY